jgi:hypothetical protein
MSNEVKDTWIYGTGVCAGCGKRLFAILSTNAVVIPPPVIKVGCGCTTPPTTVELFYHGHRRLNMPALMRREIKQRKEQK